MSDRIFRTDFTRDELHRLVRGPASEVCRVVFGEHARLGGYRQDLLQAAYDWQAATATELAQAALDASAAAKADARRRAQAARETHDQLFRECAAAAEECPRRFITRRGRKVTIREGRLPPLVLTGQTEDKARELVTLLRAGGAQAEKFMVAQRLAADATAQRRAAQAEERRLRREVQRLQRRLPVVEVNA